MLPRGEPPPAAGASERFRYFRYDELIARDKANLEAALASFREVAEELRDTPAITVLPSL